MFIPEKKPYVFDEEKAPKQRHWIIHLFVAAVMIDVAYNNAGYTIGVFSIFMAILFSLFALIGILK